MIYLSQFEFPHIETEYAFLHEVKHTCYDTVYPFQVLSRHQMREIEFAPVTIFYGGNGSGKTTALNVIAEKLYRRVIGLFVVIFIAEQFLFNFIFVAFMRVSDNQFSDETGDK